MKYLVLLAVVALSSCSQVFLDSPSLDLDTAWQATASHRYIPQVVANEWKSPEEFQRDHGGDCEDFVTYMLWLLGPNYGAQLAAIHVGPWDTIALHAVVELPDGRLIEPQCYDGSYPDSTMVLFTMSYTAVMRQAY